MCSLFFFISVFLVVLIYGSPASERNESLLFVDSGEAAKRQRLERQIYCPPGFKRRYTYVTHRYTCVPNTWVNFMNK
jgi:hypothetical protein